MDVKGAADEDSEGNNEHVIRNWRKGDPCYIVAESASELCYTVRWEAELVSN